MFKKIVLSDKYRRTFFLQTEYKRRFSKIIKENLKLEKTVRTHHSLKMGLNFSKNTSIPKLRNRCIITGRGRSIYSDFRLSRMQLRHLASFGYLMGIKKSSW